VPFPCHSGFRFSFTNAVVVRRTRVSQAAERLLGRHWRRR